MGNAGMGKRHPGTETGETSLERTYLLESDSTIERLKLEYKGQNTH